MRRAKSFTPSSRMLRPGAALVLALVVCVLSGCAGTVRLVLPGEYDLILRLPARSYTSLLLEGDAMTVSGVGG
jgi:hypothetical protein